VQVVLSFLRQDIYSQDVNLKRIEAIDKWRFSFSSTLQKNANTHENETINAGLVITRAKI